MPHWASGRSPRRPRTSAGLLPANRSRIC